MLAVVLGLPVATGWLAVRALLGTTSCRPRWAAVLFEASLGAGAGMGLASSLHFLLLLAGIRSPAAGIALEGLLLAATVWLAIRMRSPQGGGAGGERAFRWNWALAVVLCAGAALAALAFAALSNANPTGDWDAWSIWNLRARMLAAPGDAWKSAYSPLLEHTHPYYPLLVSGFISRCWRFTGEVSSAASIAVAALFQAAAAALLVSAVALLRSACAGLLAGLVLLASSRYLWQGPRQYADVPLSFFGLGALALLLWASTLEQRRNAALVLAGACGGFAAWTKNEGLMFFGVLMAALLLVEWRTLGLRTALARWFRVVLGALPIMLMTLYFKFFLAPGSPPFLSTSAEDTLARLSGFGRHWQVVSAFAAEAWRLGDPWTHPILLLAILAAALRFERGSRQLPWAVAAGSSILVVMAGFYATYVATQLDLRWLLGTSVDRLFAQLWPAFLLIAFTVLRRPEEVMIGQAVILKAGKHARKEKRRRG